MPLCTWTPTRPVGTSDEVSPGVIARVRALGGSALRWPWGSRPSRALGGPRQRFKGGPHRAGAWRSSATSGQKQLGLQTERRFSPGKRGRERSAFALMGLRVHASLDFLWSWGGVFRPMTYSRRLWSTLPSPIPGSAPTSHLQTDHFEKQIELRHPSWKPFEAFSSHRKSNLKSFPCPLRSWRFVPRPPLSRLSLGTPQPHCPSQRTHTPHSGLSPAALQIPCTLTSSSSPPPNPLLSSTRITPSLLGDSHRSLQRALGPLKPPA